MNEQKSVTTTNVALVIFSVGGFLALTTGFDLITPVFWTAAIVLAFVQRSTLAKAIRTPGTNRRRKRFSTAAVLTIIFVAAALSYLVDLRDNEISTASLLIHNAIGNTAMIGAIIYFVMGLFTPREARTIPQM